MFVCGWIRIMQNPVAKLLKRIRINKEKEGMFRSFPYIIVFHHIFPSLIRYYIDHHI